MFKKMFMAVTLSVCLVFGAGAAMADPPEMNGASGSYEVRPTSHDYDSSGLYWGNDGAWSEAAGFTYAGNFNNAQGSLFAGQAGYATGWNDSDACAFDIDFGTTSIAGARASVEGYGRAFGGALGIDWWSNGPDYADSLSIVEVGGSVIQDNWANEVGYWSGTYAMGENFSGGSFTAGASDFDSDYGTPWWDLTAEAASEQALWGSIETCGFTWVTVDPCGWNQSASGFTFNFVDVDTCGAEYYSGNVFGAGRLSLGAQVGSSYAQTGGSFSYTGSSFGMGATMGHANVQNYGGYSSATAYGSSFAFSK